MEQTPVFDSWESELDYYALSIREMKHSAFPEKEEVYICSSRYYLVDEVVHLLKYLQQKNLYVEYADLRNHSR